MVTPDPNSGSKSEPESSSNGGRNWLVTLLSTNIARHVLLVAGLLGVILFVAGYSQNYADRKAFEWLNKYNGKEENPNGLITTTFSNTNTNAATPQPDGANANDNLQTPPADNAATNANTNQTPGSGNGNANQTPPAKQNGNASGAAGGKASPTPSPKPSPDLKPLDTNVKKRLDEQLQSIRARINHHGAVMAYFFEAFYMAISVMMFTALIVALTLFFIAQRGWMLTNQYIKNIFLVMTAATAYYGLFPPVFQQQQNISDNKALFLAHKSLENEVVSYPLTRTNMKGENKTPQEFIAYVDSELSRLGNIAIGFDYTKISYTGTFETPERKSTPGNSNVNSNTKQGNKNQ